MRSNWLWSFALSLVAAGLLVGCGTESGGVMDDGGAAVDEDGASASTTIDENPPPDTSEGNELYLLTEVDEDGNEINARRINARSYRRFAWKKLLRALSELSETELTLVTDNPFEENPINLESKPIADVVEEVLDVDPEENPWKALERGDSFYYWEPGLGDVFVGDHRVEAGPGGWVIVFEDELELVPPNLRFTIVDENGNLVADELFDEEELADSDGDGIPDSDDACPSTGSGEIVNPGGCSPQDYADQWNNENSTETGEGEDGANENGEEDQETDIWRDEDVDGVHDIDDECPGTPNAEVVDESGCGDSQKDSDQDGITDDIDECANTPEGSEVDEYGCKIEEPEDTDGDGISDVDDDCFDTPSNSEVDANGCALSQKDTDGDGITDDTDLCPTEGGEYLDDDGCPIEAPIASFQDDELVIEGDRSVTVEWYADGELIGTGQQKPTLPDHREDVRAEMEIDWNTAYAAEQSGFTGTNFLERSISYGYDEDQLELVARVKDTEFPALVTEVARTETVKTLIVRGRNGGTVVTAPNGGERRRDFTPNLGWGADGVWLFIPNSYMDAGETGGVRITLDLAGSGDYSFHWTWKDDGNGHYYFWEMQGVGSGTVTGQGSVVTFYSTFDSPHSDGHVFIGWDNDQTGGGCRAAVQVTDNGTGEVYSYDVSMNVE